MKILISRFPGKIKKTHGKVTCWSIFPAGKVLEVLCCSLLYFAVIRYITFWNWFTIYLSLNSICKGITEITKVCLTLPDIQSGKDSLFTRPNRISQNRKNIKLFLQWASGCFQPRATNFSFLVLVTQNNYIYFFEHC